MPFTSPLQIELQDVRAINVNKQHKLGALAYTSDGRVFAYGQAGASALAPGKLAQIPAVVANHQALVTAAAAVYATKITVTLGGTAATADQYADGFAVIRDATGAGQAFPIVGNSAQTSTTGTVDVYLGEGVATALDSTSITNLELAPMSNMLISDHTVTTQRVMGVPQVSVTAAYYAWFQVRGVSSVLGNGTITKGSGIIPSATTDGAVDIEATTTITQRLGTALETGTSAKYNTVFLQIS